MQPHCALILVLKWVLGVLPLQVNINCSGDKQGPCLLKTPDLDSVYSPPRVPWPPSSAHAGGRDMCFLDPGATIPGHSLGSAGTLGFWALIPGCTAL